jgi:hypothetical protein
MVNDETIAEDILTQKALNNPYTGTDLSFAMTKLTYKGIPIYDSEYNTNEGRCCWDYLVREKFDKNILAVS